MSVIEVTCKKCGYEYNVPNSCPVCDKRIIINRKVNDIGVRPEVSKSRSSVGVVADELKPCPFCGEVVKIFRYGEFINIQHQSNLCHMFTATTNYPIHNRSKLIEDWNRRVTIFC